MATNIPPHNLGEVVDVLCVLIHNPEATVSAKSFSLSLSQMESLKTGNTKVVQQNSELSPKGLII